MSTTFLRWAINHAARGICEGNPGSWRPATDLLFCRGGVGVLAGRWQHLSTTVEEARDKQPSKKKNLRTRATIGSVGRNIQQRLLQVISETGGNLGTMHRADVLRLMDEKGLKLIALNEGQDPPVYQLMSGKQIHEEQLKLREKQKGQAGPMQVKELTLFSEIAPHDLDTKLRKVQHWLDKKHHVRLVVKKRTVDSTLPLEAALEEMVKGVEGAVAYVSPPKLIQNDRAAMCVLRRPSAKELSKKANGVTTDPDTNPPSPPMDLAQDPLQQQ